MPIDGAAEKLAAAFVDDAREYETRFYFTETGIGLYLSNADGIYAEGDYWIFEAQYRDIESILKMSIVNALEM